LLPKGTHWLIIGFVKPYTWDPHKNERLIRERGLSFEAILWSIQSGGLLDIVKHSNPGKYPNQKVYVVKAFDYVFLVPFEENDHEIRLITIIPSRKALRMYIERSGSDENQT
jgi:hypothetical protein